MVTHTGVGVPVEGCCPDGVPLGRIGLPVEEMMPIPELEETAP